MIIDNHRYNSTSKTNFEIVARSLRYEPNNTQIYEGTNQIQRVVMARQLLKG